MLIGTNCMKYSPICWTMRSSLRRQVGGCRSARRSWMSRYIKVGVSDTGCGISEEHLLKIFDKFYRVPSSSAQVAGAGLGLAITRGLVELHGGTIAVESVPGQGSHFYFTLPYN